MSVFHAIPGPSLMGVLILAAVSEELRTLPGKPLGVGPVVSGVRAAMAIRAAGPAQVVLVGTAGRYPGGPPIGAVVVASRLGWADAGAVAGLGYVPLPPPTLEADPVPPGLARLPTATVLTLAAITTRPDVVRSLAVDWQVEHLEAYAVALAAREAGVPFVAVLGITNDVGPDAHPQWLANRDGLQSAVEEAVRTAFALGARGA